MLCNSCEQNGRMAIPISLFLSHRKKVKRKKTRLTRVEKELLYGGVMGEKFESAFVCLKHSSIFKHGMLCGQIIKFVP